MSVSKEFLEKRAYQMTNQLIQEVANLEKGLKPIVNPRLIVELFVKEIGVDSSMECDIAKDALKSLVERDPFFVESFLKKCWQKDKCFGIFSVDLLKRLLKELLKEGHSESTILSHALQLFNSKFSFYQSKGIELFIAIAEVSKREIPLTFDRMKT